MVRGSPELGLVRHARAAVAAGRPYGRDLVGPASELRRGWPGGCCAGTGRFGSTWATRTRAPGATISRPGPAASGRSQRSAALQDEGWILRSDVIWHKPNPLPESVRDRPTRAHEYVFMFAAGRRYYYDADAVRTPSGGRKATRRGPERRDNANRDELDAMKANGYTSGAGGARTDGRLTGARHAGFRAWDARSKHVQQADGASLRDVWPIATQPYRGAHFATFPEELVRRCVLAGCPEHGTVLDPFHGSGTVGLVARREDRSFVGIELRAEYVAMADRRIAGDGRAGTLPLFGPVEAGA